MQLHDVIAHYKCKLDQALAAKLLGTDQIPSYGTYALRFGARIRQENHTDLIRAGTFTRPTTLTYVDVCSDAFTNLLH